MTGIRSVIHWLRFPLPNTDDPEVRRRVVFSIIGLAMLMFVANVWVVGENVRLRDDLDSATRVVKNLCVSQQHGRAQGAIRNGQIRAYLLHKAEPPAPSIAASIIDSPPIDCETGLEVKLKERKP